MLIVIAEDEEILRMELVSLLERHGHTVLEAANGEDVLEIIFSRLQNHAPIDLIILDNDMPHLTGLQVVRATRSVSLRHQIWIRSGRAEYIRSEAELAGADKVLAKLEIHEELRKNRIVL